MRGREARSLPPSHLQQHGAARIFQPDIPHNGFLRGWIFPSKAPELFGEYTAPSARRCRSRAINPTLTHSTTHNFFFSSPYVLESLHDVSPFQ